MISIANEKPSVMHFGVLNLKIGILEFSLKNYSKTPQKCKRMIQVFKVYLSFKI